MWFLKVFKKFNDEKLSYAVVGGFAVALHGASRGTIDLDIIINLTLESLTTAERCLIELGFTSKLPITGLELSNFREEYIKKRNLVAWSFYEQAHPAHIVDVVITHDLKKMKTKTIKVHGTNIKILSIDDLIKMKKQSGRPQDLEDVSALERLK